MTATWTGWAVAIFGIASWSADRGQPTTLRRQLRQGAPGRDGVGVVGAADALADGEGLLEGRLGAG